MNCPSCNREVEMLKSTTTGRKCRECHGLETGKMVSSCCLSQAGMILKQDGATFDSWECAQCGNPCELEALKPVPTDIPTQDARKKKPKQNKCKLCGFPVSSDSDICGE